MLVWESVCGDLKVIIDEESLTENGLVITVDNDENNKVYSILSKETNSIDLSLDSIHTFVTNLDTINLISDEAGTSLIGNTFFPNINENETVFSQELERDILITIKNKKIVDSNTHIVITNNLQLIKD